MSTKKQPTKTVDESVKIYPVEIELTETFLEKNPTIKEMYKEGELKIELSSQIEPDFAETITDVIADLKSRELVLFNPLISAINNIAEFQNVVGTTKPKRTAEMDDKEYEKTVRDWIKSEEEVIKKMTSMIRSFNGSATSSKKKIKEPIIAAGKKIDILYNALKDFSDKVKSKVESNFKPLLDEKAEIEQKKLDALKAAETAQIAELEQKNEEANQKILEQSKKVTYADLTMEITQYFSEIDSQIDQLNISGLQVLRNSVSEKQFEINGVGPLEEANLAKLINTMKESSILKIDSHIAGDKDQFEKSEEQEFKDNLKNYPNGDPTVAVTDSEIFVKASYHLANMKRECSRITCEFKDPRLQKLSATLQTQMSGLSENINKLIAFIDKKAEAYNNL